MLWVCCMTRCRGAIQIYIIHHQTTLWVRDDIEYSIIFLLLIYMLTDTFVLSLIVSYPFFFVNNIYGSVFCFYKNSA